MRSDEELKMTYSSILSDREGRRFVRVQFEREGMNGTETAEGILPEGRIVRSHGFSDEEKARLEEYLKAQSAEIMSQAKGISNPLKWLS